MNKLFRFCGEHPFVTYFLLMLIGTVASVLPSLAHADDILTWKHPTQYTDNTALAVADIDYSIVRWFDPNDPTIILGSVQVTAPAITTTIPRDTMVVGTRCYQVATVMKASAGGRQSGFGPTDGSCKSITQPVGKKPKIPQNVVVN